jgi:hypothetical protein
MNATTSRLDVTMPMAGAPRRLSRENGEGNSRSRAAANGI